MQAVPALSVTRSEPVSRAARIPLLALPWAWAAAALALAAHRLPYDDEWFEISLAHADPHHFSASLAADVHLPWVALLDRGIVHLAPGFLPLVVPRVAASALALFLVASLVTRRRLAPWWAVALAAFHPVLLMYGGAARWYPFLFLGQALRAWALWGADAGTVGADGALLAGALVGTLAGYLDLPFLVIDGTAWLLTRSGTRARVVVAASCAVLVAGTLLTPLSHPAGRLVSIAASRFQLSLTAFVEWLGLGLAGEAHPGWPLTLLALLVLPGFAAAAWAIIRRRDGFSRWLLAVALGWCGATQVGVWHPRYSLLVWALFTAAMLGGLAAPGARRTASVVAAGYLALGLLLTVRGDHFLKGDLNSLPAAARASLLEDPADLVIAPYPRTAAQVSSVWRPAAPVVAVPLIQQYPDRDEQMSSLRAALASARRVVLITVPDRSWLRVTNPRVRAELRSRCHLVASHEAVEDPFWPLKRWLSKSTARYRFRSETWDCPRAR